MAVLIFYQETACSPGQQNLTIMIPGVLRIAGFLFRQAKQYPAIFSQK
jgi:hypothetical protein